MDIQNVNKQGWNELVKSGVKYTNSSLPDYGPFMDGEEKLKLFSDVKNCNVLELGCAKGDSLLYLKKLGAKETWGIDISEEQIKYAIENGINKEYLFLGEMSDNYPIPNSYFDYVFIV